MPHRPVPLPLLLTLLLPLAACSGGDTTADIEQMVRYDLWERLGPRGTEISGIDASCEPLPFWAGVGDTMDCDARVHRRGGYESDVPVRVEFRVDGVFSVPLVDVG